MYHYVIVGAGSAGCVLAHRLSADPETRVLLLEAGPADAKREIHIPAAMPKLFKTEVDWNYATEPQDRLGGRRVYWPRGKVLGGCSSTNAMIYVRGHRLDYDAWAALGNRGWAYEDLLPYFKKSENFARGGDVYHGTDGPLYVEDLRDPNPLSRAFVAACEEMGIPRNDDFNGAEQDGAGLNQVTQHRGRRCSTAAAFLHPVMHRPNLDVVTEAQVTRLVLDGRHVIGVEYLWHGEKRTARAREEVLLAAGAINSPQVLMCSGIGPAAALREHGIDVQHDLPGVGQNLQDHVITPVRYAIRQPLSLMTAERPGPMLQYLLLRKGKLTSNLAEACAFVRTRADLPAPDLQFHFIPGLFQRQGLDWPTEHGITLCPTLLTPKSVGSITLRSADPLDAPIIEPNYLSDADDHDLQVLMEGVRLARCIALASPFARYRDRAIAPADETLTDAALADFVRKHSATLYHPVGTCKMGHDDAAVVDETLRVHGLQGLRVVDASIMPVLVRGNTNAPAIMIAEKAAALILNRTPAAASERATAPA